MPTAPSFRRAALLGFVLDSFTLSVLEFIPNAGQHFVEFIEVAATRQTGSQPFRYSIPVTVLKPILDPLYRVGLRTVVRPRTVPWTPGL